MRARGFVLGAAVAALLGGASVAAPAQAENLSVGYSGHLAFRGTDDAYFTGLVLSGQSLFAAGLGPVVSKYVGETEKNLDAVFERLGAADIVLYFAEADALFGKRSDVKDAHDRYAENFIVLDPVERTWRGLIVLGPDDGVREDGVYELSGRYGDLVVTPIPAPASFALFALAIGGLLAGRMLRRRRL